MTKSDLNTSEFNTYYHQYIDKLSDNVALIKGFENGKDEVINFFNKIPKDKLNFRYQPEKWSIKEVLQHLIDTERIFMYRCFRIARHDVSSLTGYDQNIYNAPSKAKDKTLENLLNEFITNRNNSIAILSSLTNEDLCFIGNSSGNKMSARAAAFIIIGHDIWHMEVIKSKYL